MHHTACTLHKHCTANCTTHWTLCAMCCMRTPSAAKWTPYTLHKTQYTVHIWCSSTQNTVHTVQHKVCGTLCLLVCSIKYCTPGVLITVHECTLPYCKTRHWWTPDDWMTLCTDKRKSITLKTVSDTVLTALWCIYLWGKYMRMHFTTAP